MKRMAWTSRIFKFDLPEAWLDNVLERLHGTSARLRSMVDDLTEEEAGLCRNGTWSIKQHIGHLHDLEELHMARIEDLKNRKDQLCAADMSNLKTEEAGHNEVSTDQLIVDFNNSRLLLIQKIKELDDESQYFASMHPRLNIKMRAIDVASFTADHDDHHLASIRAILYDFDFQCGSSS